MEPARRTLMTQVPRSLVLVPSERARAEVAADAADNLGLQVFSADTIEESKEAFVKSSGSVAIFANRYDGIDFPGGVAGLPSPAQRG
jgi:Rad3-related DNA helicase